MYSVVIPVYRNEEFIPLLIQEFSAVARRVRERFGLDTEFVFVVDASPDRCHEKLAEALPRAPFPSQLLLHSRNFGSFAAIRTGLKAGRGDYFAVIAADLQEPPELLVQFLEKMIPHADGDGHDVAVGVREGRDDPGASKLSANLFWALYRRLVVKEIPAGGVDVFGCRRVVRDQLLGMGEANSSLVGQLFWLGFRRAEVGYHRRGRAFGKSGWTLSKKINYLLDSIFAFTDLPVRLLSVVGLAGLAIGFLVGLVVVLRRLVEGVEVPGYAAIMAAVVFFGSINALGLGVVGTYAWRAYENSKGRPLAVLRDGRRFDGLRGTAGCEEDGR